MAKIGYVSTKIKTSFVIVFDLHYLCGLEINDLIKLKRYDDR